MKVGDKVRYLNAIGGGIVKGFKGKDIVIVDDDGFDTPVLIRECVVIEPAGKSETKVAHSDPKKVIVSESRPEPEPAVIEETPEGEKITLCLAFLPTEIKSLNNTKYECYLINDSNYFLSYNYMTATGHSYESLSSGIIEPNTKIFVEEFDKTALNNREVVYLQFIAFKKNKPYAMKDVYSIEQKINTVNFYKLHSFKENDYFNEDAIVYYLVKNDLIEKGLSVSGREIQEAMMDKKFGDSFIPKKKQQVTKAPVIEVDLHINELLDNTNGLSNSDMLEYQLSKFREAMEVNKNRKGQKIVFIHGKGNGVLKSAILKELKEKYNKIYYQDASFKEYGFGATMVTIK